MTVAVSMSVSTLHLMSVPISKVLLSVRLSSPSVCFRHHQAGFMVSRGSLQETGRFYRVPVPGDVAVLPASEIIAKGGRMRGLSDSWI